MQARWLSVALLVGRAATLCAAAEPRRTYYSAAELWFENGGSLFTSFPWTHGQAV